VRNDWIAVKKEKKKERGGEKRKKRSSPVMTRKREKKGGRIDRYNIPKKKKEVPITCSLWGKRKKKGKEKREVQPLLKEKGEEEEKGKSLPYYALFHNRSYAPSYGGKEKGEKDRGHSFFVAKRGRRKRMKAARSSRL